MSEEIKWIIEPDDIEWEMDWGDKVNSRGISGKEMIFEKDKALAHLLLNEVVHLNSHWWKFSKMGKSVDEGGWTTEPREDATWTKEESELISVSVGCNDVFAWGCADSEPLPYKDIETLYRMWLKDPGDGHSVWCAIQRNQMPQKPVERDIRKAGIWDLDKLGLGANTQDAECKAYLSAVIRANKVA